MPEPVTITTTPTLLVAAKSSSLRSWFMLEVAAGGARIYVAPRADVTVQTGFAIEPTASNASTLFASGKPGETAWYGVVASGEQVCKVQEGAGAGSSRGNNDMINIFRPGKSAYDLAVDEGYAGTLQEWLAGLQVSTPLPSDILRGTIDGSQTMVAITDRDGNPITQAPYVP
jgi:hypothetical protein